MDDEKLAHKANEHTTSETSVGWMTVMWTEAANYDDDIVTLRVARSQTPAANPFLPQLDLLSILEKAKNDILYDFFLQQNSPRSQ